MTTQPVPQTSELKARHRAIWASGDYSSMVETFLLPLGPALVEACGIGPGARVLDVRGYRQRLASRGPAWRPSHRERPHARAARGGQPPSRSGRCRLGLG